jgi:Tfp pilus assembly protein PilF
MKSTQLLEGLAKAAGSGNVYVNLAEAYLQHNEWGRAVIALEKALRKGHLEDQHGAFKLLSEAHGKLDHRQLAQRYQAEAIQVK